MKKSNFLLKWAAIGTVALSSLGALTGAEAATWQLSGSIVTHDPSIWKDGTTWWIFETSETGIGIKYSADGHAWKQGLSLFPNGLPWWSQYVDPNKPKMAWAPDIHVWNNRAIVFYALSSLGSHKSAIGLATATSIAKGNWVDHGSPILSSTTTSQPPTDTTASVNAIDPNFVVDASGQPWLAFGSWFGGLYITKLDPSTLMPYGVQTKIAADSKGIENSFISYHNGYYYLFASKGTCCATDPHNDTYHIVYGRSKTIDGTYLDKANNKLLYGGGTTLDSGVGGNFTNAGGESIANGVMVSHEIDVSTNNAIMFIQDIHYDASDWPAL